MFTRSAGICLTSLKRHEATFIQSNSSLKIMDCEHKTSSSNLIICHCLTSHQQHFHTEAQTDMCLCTRAHTHAHTSVSSPYGSGFNSSRPILSHTWLRKQWLVEPCCQINLCSQHGSVFQGDWQSDGVKGCLIVTYCQNNVNAWVGTAAFEERNCSCGQDAIQKKTLCPPKST